MLSTQTLLCLPKEVMEHLLVPWCGHQTPYSRFGGALKLGFSTSCLPKEGMLDVRPAGRLMVHMMAHFVDIDYPNVYTKVGCHLKPSWVPRHWLIMQNVSCFADR